MHKPESERGTEAALMAVVAPDLKQVCAAYSRTERTDYNARIELLFAGVMALAQRPSESGDEASVDSLTLALVEELEQRVGEMAERETLLEQRNAALQRQNKELADDLASMKDQLESLMRIAEKAAHQLEVHARKFGAIEVDHDLLLHLVGENKCGNTR